MPHVRSIVTVVALLALCAPLALAVAALSGVGHRWIDILAQFTAPAFMATLALVVVILACRLWIAGGVGGFVLLLLFVAAWPQGFASGGKPRPDTRVISLYSANLYRGNDDVEAIRASIRTADADMVVLIEVGPAPLRRLDEIIGHYPYRLARPGSRSPSETWRVIASRYPLTEIPGRPDGLNEQGAVVATPFGPLNLMAVHLTRPWPFQYQWGQITQVMALDEVLADLRGPVIAAGDFNSVSSARIGRQIRNDLDLLPTAGWPGTWPAQLPSFLGITIDQVYRSPDLAIVDRRLGRRNGSDHRPVVTRFTLAEPPRPAP